MSAVASATPSSPAVSSPTIGPRSLQLLESNLSPGSSSPVLSPRTVSSLGLSTPPPSARSFKSPNPRRQSSISYFPSDHVDLRSPTISRSGVSPRRTHSMGIWTVEGRAKGDRRSLGSLMKDVTAPPASPGPSVDYGPLTLSEKHADLLQFIAQKESKCLELRLQLAVQEAELAELKRKWERIVSRGMDRAYSSPLTTSRSPNPAAVSPSFPVSSIIPTAGTAIKEGVRLLAAGFDLSASEPSSPQAFSPPAVPISGFATVSRATLASAAAMKKAAANKHAANQSISSVSTATTSSASTPSQRLSQSSASSLLSSFSLEDSVEEECDSRPPPISEERPEVLAETIQLNSPRSLNSRLRRRSKDAESLQSSSTVGLSTTSTKSSSSARRQSRTHDTPLSSNAAAPRSDNSGWMGSVGKKWEDMQRGEAPSKAQKRSSIFLEMSQSIFNVLASTTPTSPVPGKPSLLSAPPSASPASLLDDEPEHRQSLGAVMVPKVVNSASAHAPLPSQPAKSADDDDEEWNW